MEEIVKVIVYSICGIITAASGLVIAYLNNKAKKIEAEKNKVQKEKEQLRAEIKSLHNGFREYVYKEIKELKDGTKELRTDMKLVKNLVVENKVHYKELEGKK